MRNLQNPKILWRISDSNCVLFLHGASVDEGGTGGRLVASMCIRLRVRMERGSTDFLCSVFSLGSLVGYLIGGGGTG